MRLGESRSREKYSNKDIAPSCIVATVCLEERIAEQRKKVFEPKENTRHRTPSQPRYNNQNIVNKGWFTNA